MFDGSALMRRCEMNRALDRAVRRFRSDASFHALVTRFRQALAQNEVSAPDLRDAVRMACALNALDNIRDGVARRANQPSATALTDVAGTPPV